MAVALLAVLASLLPEAFPALAAGAACPQTSELAMETKVMCQVCGVPLAVASSLEADRERAFIRTLVNRCESASQIEAAMVAQYGPGILATPGTHGFAVAAWVVPAAAILLAALGVGMVLRPVRRLRVESSASRGPEPSPDEERRLDAALSTFRAGR